MKKLYLIMVFLCLLILTLAQASIPKSRSVEFNYGVVLNNLPANASEVKIWLPYIPQMPYQEIEEIKLTPDGIAKITQDRSYHNKILYYQFESPQRPISIDVHYKIRRYEFSNNFFHYIPEKTMHKDLNKYLRANKLVTLSPKIRQIAQEITKGEKTTMGKAKAIYDYVFENVSYDKNIPGWGNGDTERVCRLKAGNCTDFHSLFISLARASDIPAKFVIGASLPKDHEGELKGYHCWAEFYDENIGWVPIDISEAWKDKAKKDYYFGTLNEDRIEFTQGRDIILEPAAHSEPLNYFVYPYIEINGQSFKDFQVSFKFKDES